MKIKLIFVSIVVLMTTKIQAQKHEIGIGFPTIGFNITEGAGADANFLEWGLKRNSEVYTLHMHTWRDHSDVSPVFYYTRRVASRFALRFAFSYQKEYIVQHFYANTADAGNVSPDFKGRYTQIKFGTGISYTFKKGDQRGLYIALDITPTIKHIYERGSYDNWAWGYQHVDYYTNTTSAYFGINPCIGYKLQLNKSLSCSYEFGVFYDKYHTKHVEQIPVLLINPLNRLSINYKL